MPTLLFTSVSGRLESRSPQLLLPGLHGLHLFTSFFHHLPTFLALLDTTSSEGTLITWHVCVIELSQCSAVSRVGAAHRCLPWLPVVNGFLFTQIKLLQ